MLTAALRNSVSFELKFSQKFPIAVLLLKPSFIEILSCYWETKNYTEKPYSLGTLTKSNNAKY